MVIMANDDDRIHRNDADGPDEQPRHRAHEAAFPVATWARDVTARYGSDRAHDHA